MAGEAFWLPLGDAASSFGELTDVDLTTTAPASGDLVRFDGANWVPVAQADVVGGGGRWEVVVTGTPAEAVTTEDETDWLYTWVSD